MPDTHIDRFGLIHKRSLTKCTVCRGAVLTETIKELHRCDLELLSAFKKLCKEHNIKYFLYGGSMLGSVRHNDFIPWDDDLDVVLFRDDYEKFRVIPQEDYPEGFRTVFPIEGNIFCDFIPKFTDTRNNAKRIDYPGYEEIYPCLGNPCIDLLILNKAHKGFRQKMRILTQQFIYVLARGHRATLSKDIRIHSSSSMKANGLKWIVRPIQWIGKRIPLRKEYRWYECISKKCNGGEMLYISNDVPILMYRRYDPSWFRDDVRMKIREREFPVPIGYEDMLKEMYGDYMELPPVESRK